MALRKITGTCPGCGSDMTATERRYRASGMCAGCVESSGDDDPVSGNALRTLREEAQIDRAALADLLNKADHRNNGETYESALLTIEDVRRMESALVHKSFIARVAELLTGRTNDMTTNNGVSEQSAAIQVATTNARKALAEYEALEADAQALAEEVNATIAALLGLGEPLRLALQRRYAAFHMAVSAERTRARLSNSESNEESIRIRAWRPIIRVPAGVIANIEINPEYSVSVVPMEVDTALLEQKSPAFDYLPTGEPVPMRRGKG